MCFAPQRRALFRHLNFQKCSETQVFCTCSLGNVLRATTACTFWTSQLPKVLRDRPFLTLFTSKCASRHNAVHFFDIWTSKSGPNPWCFYILALGCASRHNGVHFFDIATSKSGPTMVCFVHFDLEMCFAPQRCNFSSLIWPAGSAPAALASLLFDPPEPQIIGKTEWIATFLPFHASPSSFFLLFLFYSSLF